MKRVIMVLSVVLSFVFAGVALASQTPATADLQSYVESFVTEDIKATGHKIVSLTVTPGECTISNGVAEQVFEVNAMTLSAYARAEDSPVYKAKEKFLKDNKGTLSTETVCILERDLAEWKVDLDTYAKTPWPLFERIKAVARLNEAGKVIAGSIELYGEGAQGEYVPRKKFDKTTEQVFEEVLSNTKDMAAQLESDIANKPVTVTVTGLYDRLAARDYINTWTSNTTKPCRTGSTTTQDTSYYNPQYQWYECNDCANYVSQALRRGGIPTDSSWYPGSVDWINVYELEQHFKNEKKYWEPTNTTGCVAGYPIVIASGAGHVVMVSYNNGSEIRYSAHTNDRKDVKWYYPSTARYYKVTY